MPTQTRYASKDAHMGKSMTGTFSGWNGKDNHLPLGVSAGTGSYKYRSVVAFNIDFSVMQSITNATLTLYHNSSGDNQHCDQAVGETSNIRIARMTKDWAEGNIDPGEGNLSSQMDYSWDNRYDSFTNVNEVQIGGFSQTSAMNQDPYDINVTTLVQEWFSGRPNYGFMIYNNNEVSKDKGVQFFSRSGPDAYRPKLVITYETNTPPGQPTLTSPTGNEIITNLVPSMSGVSSDVDSGDFITAVAITAQASYAKMLYSSSTTMQDPGSGYFRIDTVNHRLAMSKTDANGTPIDYTKFNYGGWELQYPGLSSYIISPLSQSNVQSVLSQSSYFVYDYALPFSTLGALATGYMFDVYPSGDSVWDSGSIAISNAPKEFGVSWGSGNSAAQLQGGKSYRWKAQTRDKAYEWGPLSNWAYFRTNTLPNAPTLTILESPTTALPTLTPRISVSHSDNDPEDSKMIGYEITIESESSAGSGIWSSVSTTEVPLSPAVQTSTFNVSVPLEWASSYRVKARTKDSSGSYGAYSQWKTFATYKTGKPINLAPSGDTITSSTPTFIGQRSNLIETITSYRIYLEPISTPGTFVIDQTFNSGISGGSSFSLPYPSGTLTAGAAYRWQARVTSSIGGLSDWSDWQYFSVADANTPVITAPVGDNAYTTNPTITVTRSAANFNAMSFEMYPGTATEANTGSYIYASPTMTFTSASSYSHIYYGTPIEYSTTYKTRARVSDNSGTTWSPWSGLTQFKTDSTGAPTLTTVSGQSPSTDLWITATQPSFGISAYGADTIDYMQVQVLDSVDSGIVWDSGLANVANASTASITMSAESLTQGSKYNWRALYKNTIGKMSPYTTSPYSFTVNSPPSTPSNISPSSAGSEDGFASLPNTLLPTFRATFNDLEKDSFADSPSGWYIIVEAESGGVWNPAYTKSIGSGLTSAENTYFWTADDYAFANGSKYQWKTYFTDQKGAVGAYSPSQGFIFASAPNGTWSSPSENSFSGKSTINTLTPTLSWTYTGSGSGQYSFKIKVDELDDNGNPVNVQSKTINIISSSPSYTLPYSGYLENRKNYRLTLTVTNNALIDDTSPSVTHIYVNTAAPNAITNVSSDTGSGHSAVLTWNASNLANEKFVAYRIQRRVMGKEVSEGSFQYIGDGSWDVIGLVKSQSVNTFTDWYAGNNIRYQYKVTVLAKVGPQDTEVESPEDSGGESVCESQIDGDIWQFIPGNRSKNFLQELPVIDASHNKVIQQESFETLGSRRKTIIRGFVLGDEGSITCVWKNEEVPSPGDAQVYYNETVIARRWLNYISTNKGPHILKSPFGDVWDVQFEGPEIVWMPGGILQASVSWVETGTEGEDAI